MAGIRMLKAYGVVIAARAAPSIRQFSISIYPCLACSFTLTDRHSDMTISDCWGLERNMPDFDDNCGTSLVIVNTETGRRWFDKIGEVAGIVHVALQDYMQPKLRHPSDCPAERFWQDYKEKGYRYIFREYGRDSLYWRLRSRVGFYKRNRIL